MREIKVRYVTDPKSKYEKLNPIEITGLAPGKVNINRAELENLIGQLIAAEWNHGFYSALKLK